MTIEDKAGMNVSMHYGPREVGGTKGEYPSAGVVKEASNNYDLGGDVADPLLAIRIPAGSVVTEIDASMATGAVASADAVDVEGILPNIDISLCDGTQATYIPIPHLTFLQIQGPTSGTVVVRYRHVAPSDVEA